MYSTGIVRRIDELGRVFIPKEIRRALRIGEGDPLEIYTDRNGEVILKKYSPIGEISSFAKDYTESLFRSLGHIACIVDRDRVVAASGIGSDETMNKLISPDLDTVIRNRQTITINRINDDMNLVPIINGQNMWEYASQIISPILIDEEVIGAVVILSQQSNISMGEKEIAAVKVITNIISYQLND